MRRILINYATMKKAGRRGGGFSHIAIEEAGLVFDEGQVDELLALDQTLDRLNDFNQRGADVVVYRFFGGLTHDESAQVMGTSEVTVRRAWTTARTWLRRELRDAIPGWERSRLGGSEATS